MELIIAEQEKKKGYRLILAKEVAAERRTRICPW